MNTYTKENFLQIISDYRGINKTIDEMSSEIAIMRGCPARWSFDRWEFNNDEPDVIKPDRENYCEINGELTNWDTDTTYAADMAEYERKLEEYSSKEAIRAIFYLGYECEYDDIQFPVSYLWTENWRELEAQDIARKKALEEEARSIASAKREVEKLERERAEFARLSAKFAGEE